MPGDANLAQPAPCWASRCHASPFAMVAFPVFISPLFRFPVLLSSLHSLSVPSLRDTPWRRSQEWSGPILPRLAPHFFLLLFSVFVEELLTSFSLEVCFFSRFLHFRRWGNWCLFSLSVFKSVVSFNCPIIKM